jgi:hypothetical protein
MLTRCERDYRWFAGLCKELTLEETSEYYGFERFLVKSPGWIHADNETRQQIVLAAKRILEEGTEVAVAAQDADFNSVLGDGAAHAMFLLLAQDPAWLEARPDEWWDIWCWYMLRELHLNLGTEPRAPKVQLFQMLHSRVQETVQTSIRALVQHDCGLLLDNLLDLMATVPDPSFDNRAIVP